MMTLGVIAGLGTAISWACSSTIHASISRTLGAHSFMMLRQPLASIILFVLCLMFDQFQSFDFYVIFLATLSGVVGIMGTDWCVYESIPRIGIRSTMICNSLSTCVTALLGVLFLEELLGIQGVIGILLATGGVILVTLAESRHALPLGDKVISPKQRAVGLALALASACTLGIAFMWGKEVLNYGMTALYFTFWRNLAASIGLWIVAIRLRRVRSTWKNFRLHPELIKLFLLGCFFGSVGGIWLSNVALQNCPAAVAATLIGLQPVALLFVSGITERRMPSFGSIMGSCIACLGAAILLLR